jgi:hypothetical protein
MKVFRTAAICSVCLVGLVCLFIAAQAVVLAFIPDGAIVRNLQKSILAGELINDEWPVSPYGHRLLDYDQYTECWALATNLGNEEKTILYRLAATPLIRVQPEPWSSPCKSLFASLHGQVPKEEFRYFRYWHGHQVYLRALLSVFDPRQHSRSKCFAVDRGYQRLRCRNDPPIWLSGSAGSADPSRCGNECSYYASSDGSFYVVDLGSIFLGADRT